MDLGRGHMDIDLAIFGSGCGALWLLREFTRRRYKAIAFAESSSLGAFASTRGQNRLHSGAMYVVANEPQPRLSNMVQACQRGGALLQEYIAEHAPGARSQEESIYAYSNESAYNDAVYCLRQSTPSIAFDCHRTDTLPRRFLDFLELRSNASWIITTDETSFDSSAILTALVSELSAMHAKLVQTRQALTGVHIERRDSEWAITIDGATYRAGAVVFACGVLNSHFMKMHMEEEPAATDEWFHRTTDRSLIRVLNSQLSRRIISFQNAGNVAHLALTPTGCTTAITTGGEFDVGEVKDVNDLRPWRDGDIPFVRALGSCLPHLGVNSQVGIHAYACQKHNNFDHPNNSHPLSSYGRRHFSWLASNTSPTAYFYCPGKWTLAALAANEFADAFAIRSPAQVSDIEDINSGQPVGKVYVAARPCFGAPSHFLDKASGQLRMHPIHNNLSAPVLL